MWINVLENPEAIKSVFEAAPSLDNVELVSITMDRDGPTVTLAVALSEPPSKTSVKRQRVGANAVAIKFQLLAVEKLSLEGWASETTVKLMIDRERGQEVTVSAVGSKIKFSCLCRFVRIQGITAYRRQEPFIPAAG